MSGLLERLTEGVVNRDMRAESHALLKKWERTGLLEGLNSERTRNTMARLLENQAKELLRESNAMSNGQVEGFATVAFPIVRRVFAGLIANDLISVQPMSLPAGLIFFLDFAFSPSLGESNTQSSRFGNVTDRTKSIYGTDRLASQITGGVNLVDSTRKGDLSGPRTSARGYAYSSPSGSSAQLDSGDAAMSGVKDVFVLDGSVSEARKKLIEFDPDLLASTDSSLTVILLDVAEGKLPDVDFDNLSAISLRDIAEGTTSDDDLFTALNGVSGISSLAPATTSQVRRLTTRQTAANAATTGVAVRFVIVASAGTFTAGSTGALGADLDAGKISFPEADSITVGTGTALGAIGGYDYPLEGNANIPEIDIKVDSIAVTAQTKKLKAKWTPELGQDLNAYHNLDAEVELTQILSEQIALEIDREILADLVTGATAAVYYWARSPGLFVNRETGAELGASSAAPDFTGTVSEWYETLVETINDVSAQIHRKTLRGGANFVVLGPEMANILEFTSGFRAFCNSR